MVGVEGGCLKRGRCECVGSTEVARVLFCITHFTLGTLLLYGIYSSLGFCTTNNDDDDDDDELAGVLARVTLFSNYYTNLYLFKIDDDR